MSNTSGIRASYTEIKLQRNFSHGFLCDILTQQTPTRLFNIYIDNSYQQCANIIRVHISLRHLYPMPSSGYSGI